LPQIEWTLNWVNPNIDPLPVTVSDPLPAGTTFVAGSLSCLVDDGSSQDEIDLDGSTMGLHVPPMIWAAQWRYTADAVLLVLASHPYDAADYIRDYDDYLALVRS